MRGIAKVSFLISIGEVPCIKSRKSNWPQVSERSPKGFPRAWIEGDGLKNALGDLPEKSQFSGASLFDRSYSDDTYMQIQTWFRWEKRFGSEPAALLKSVVALRLLGLEEGAGGEPWND